MEGVAKLARRQLTGVNIVTVAFVDDDAVGHLHYSAFDALQLIARSSELDDEEEVDHRMAGRLALSYAYGLDEYLVKTGSLTQDDGLTRLACYAAEGACRGAGTYERVGVHTELFHAR